MTVKHKKADILRYANWVAQEIVGLLPAVARAAPKGLGTIILLKICLQILAHDSRLMHPEYVQAQKEVMQKLGRS